MAEVLRCIKLQITTYEKYVQSNAAQYPVRKCFQYEATDNSTFHKTSEGKKGYLWTIFPSWNILVKTIDMPLNPVCHLNPTVSFTAWSLPGKKRIHKFLRPLLLYSISGKTSVHPFSLTLCYWSSKSKCIKHRLWKSKAKRLSIWELEIRIWMKSPNDPELTSLASEDWNCADTGRYKRQKNGIKPYLLLPYRGFPTPTSMTSQRRWSPSRKQKQEPYTLCL